MERPLSCKIGSVDVTLMKPDLCPHCGVIINPSSYTPSPINMGKFRGNKFENTYLVPLAFVCTACDKSFLGLYRWDEPNHGEINTVAHRILVYPRAAPIVFHDLVQTCSPEFVTLYKSAYIAETDGHKRLAGAGYRMALEQLIKDYLIKEEGHPAADIEGKSLYNCIGDLLSKASGLLQTADVVRILGNDFVHYQQVSSGINFEIIRSYLDIFVQLIQTELMIKHPPVVR